MKAGSIEEQALMGTLRECFTGSSVQGVFAIFAGEVRWETWDGFLQLIGADEGECRLQRLLEVRAYDKESEFHAQRSALGERFLTRYVFDDDYDEDQLLDDVQLLDIDATRSKGNSYVSTGGGRFQLPLVGATKVRLRNYIEYGSDGMGTVVDFRIVGLEAGGDA